MPEPRVDAAMLERLSRAVFSAIDQVNQARPPAQRVEKSVESVLLGEGAVLDSLGLVNLVVAVEEAVEEEFGMSVNVADEHARIQASSPLATVRSLVAYIASQVAEQIHE